MSSPAAAWRHRHLLDVDALSLDEALRILDRAAQMRDAPAAAHARMLTGHAIGLAFYEPSTRTRVSFQLAATALGATVVDLGVSASSVGKGESLIDTLRTLQRTGLTTIVLRHATSGAPYLAAREVDARLVNAGDGQHAHPTQALADALTLREALGSLRDRKVAIVGDIAHSRVARSNLHLLTKLGTSVWLAGPPAFVSGFEAWPGVRVGSLDDTLRDADAVMTLRLQLEREAVGGIPSLREYAARWGLTSERLLTAAPNAPILHPGPTNEGVEISAELAASERSLIGRQVENGVPVRMAVLSLLAEAA